MLIYQEKCINLIVNKKYTNYTDVWYMPYRWFLYVFSLCCLIKHYVCYGMEVSSGFRSDYDEGQFQSIWLHKQSHDLALNLNWWLMVKYLISADVNQTAILPEHLQQNYLKIDIAERFSLQV